MKNTFTYFFCILSLTLAFVACEKDPPQVQYDSTLYKLEYDSLTPPPIPADNKPTIQGVKLGRMLFYEKRLSGDNSISCSSCHQQKDAFSDIRRFSIGITGHEGRRQGMALANLAWHQFGFFWDGRVDHLRDQALRPIQDTIEMNEKLPNVISKLSADQLYKDQFIRTFGDDEVTSERIALALEQFEFTLISSKSKYDLSLQGKAQLSESEERGRVLFFSDDHPELGQKGAECVHCHSGINFSNNVYLNNGLDSEGRFTDLGRFEVTMNPEQKARFKVPSLRNIGLTAPYMHDGRFANLDEVIEHYNTGVLFSGTLDESMDQNLLPGGLQLNDQDKQDLKAFLMTLTDDAFIHDERFSDPF